MKRPCDAMFFSDACGLWLAALCLASGRLSFSAQAHGQPGCLCSWQVHQSPKSLSTFIYKMRRRLIAVIPEGPAAWTLLGVRGHSKHHSGLSILLVLLENPEMQIDQ